MSAQRASLATAAVVPAGRDAATRDSNCHTTMSTHEPNADAEESELSDCPSEEINGNVQEAGRMASMLDHSVASDTATRHTARQLKRTNYADLNDPYVYLDDDDTFEEPLPKRKRKAPKNVEAALVPATPAATLTATAPRTVPREKEDGVCRYFTSCSRVPHSQTKF